MDLNVGQRQGDKGENAVEELYLCGCEKKAGIEYCKR